MKDQLIADRKKHFDKWLKEERRKVEKIVVVKGTVGCLYVTVAK